MKHRSRADVVQRLIDGASELFDLRNDLRRTEDVLHDAYEDATDAGPRLYADVLVKDARDALDELDQEIGSVARQLEHLAREITKGRR